MLLAIGPQLIRVHDRLVLGVQVTPTLQEPVVVQVALPVALKARSRSSNRMVQKNVDSPLLQFQSHAFDIPGIGDPENLGIKLSVLNGRSPLGVSPLESHSASAEDRALLGSNTNADSRTKTGAGCLRAPDFNHYPALEIGIKALNPRGPRVGPQNHYPLRTRNSPKERIRI
jgi:hypothetical protein